MFAGAHLKGSMQPSVVVQKPVWERESEWSLCVSGYAGAGEASGACYLRRVGRKPPRQGSMKERGGGADRLGTAPADLGYARLCGRLKDGGTTGEGGEDAKRGSLLVLKLLG